MSHSRRKWIAVGFAAFLIFMGICSVVAKGIYAAGLPQVRVAQPSSRPISRQVEASGQVREGQEYGVYVEPGLRVATVAVVQGDQLMVADEEEGTEAARLFQIDCEDLADVIRQKELELARLESSLRESGVSTGRQRQDAQQTYARAQEDYERVERDAALMVARAREELEEAEEDLKRYQQTYGGRVQSFVSGGDAITPEEYQQSVRDLQRAVTRAARAVEDALLAQTDALQEAGRGLEDAQTAKSRISTADGAVTELEIAYLQQELEILCALSEEEGWIWTKEAGTVTQVNVNVGERTGDGAALLYTQEDGRRILEVVIDAEDGKYVELGDTVRISGGRGSTGAPFEEEMRIDYLDKSAGENCIVRLDLTGMDVRLGQSFSLRMTKQSDSYDMVVPLSALREQSGIYFVYVVETQEGIMGAEDVLRQRMVTVLDRNSSYAAIESAGISPESRVVINVDGTVGDGKPVRVME